MTKQQNVIYQLYGIDQQGEVWIGLVLLNDGGAQGLPCTLYEDLEKEKGELHLHLQPLQLTLFT